MVKSTVMGRYSYRFRRAVSLIQAIQILEYALYQDAATGSRGKWMLWNARRYLSSELQDVMISTSEYLEEVRVAFDQGYPSIAYFRAPSLVWKRAA